MDHQYSHPNFAFYFTNLGLVYEESHKYIKAKECYSKAEKIFKETFGEDHVHTQSLTQYLYEIEQLIAGE